MVRPRCASSAGSGHGPEYGTEDVRRFNRNRPPRESETKMGFSHHGRKSALRVTVNGAPVSTASVTARTETARIESNGAAVRRAWSGQPNIRIARTASAERIMVTRTDIGGRNARFGATRAENVRHGAVNATHNAFDAGATPPGGYVTATRRDAFDTDHHTHTHRCAHTDYML